MENCKYCKSEAKYQLKNGAWCCCKKYQQCPEVRRKNSLSVKLAHKEGRCTFKGLSWSCNWAKGKILKREEEIFCENNFSSGYVKNALIKFNKIEYECNICGINNWQGKPIVLELEHKDGNRNNNNLDNLVLLCPNCHSQTYTFRGRNKNNGIRKYTDKDLIKAIKKSANIRQVCFELKIAPKGGNYYVIKNKMKKLNLMFNGDVCKSGKAA